MMPFLSNNNIVKILVGNFFLSIFMLLQGCNPNNIGQELSNSFDQPEIQTNSNSKSRELEEKISAKRVDNSIARNSAAKARKSEKLTNKRKYIDLKKSIYTPRPYRITIKLSAANPSAPAESATRALRQAGINFEVERIERVNPQSKMNTPYSVEK